MSWITNLTKRWLESVSMALAYKKQQGSTSATLEPAAPTSGARGGTYTPQKEN
jgi:hypothetical protein